MRDRVVVLALPRVGLRPYVFLIRPQLPFNFLAHCVHQHSVGFGACDVQGVAVIEAFSAHRHTRLGSAEPSWAGWGCGLVGGEEVFEFR